ncbi:SPOR domain-containing protein [Fictibacillus nanhaiensis]|uniref:SPOR domain-containing protein n=1 Tax=Fictibacillus nanhaiensis TaxID=742169 RepID=UPI003AF319D6
MEDVKYELKKFIVNQHEFKELVTEEGKLYKVQIGAFKSRENAQKLSRKAKSAGFAVHIDYS